MPVPNNRIRIILVSIAAILALAFLGAIAFIAYTHLSVPKSVPMRTYVCADGSYYLVIEKEDTLLISGQTFARVGDDASRYSNGVSEIILTPDAVSLTTLADATTVSCMAGEPKGGSMPVSN